MRQPGNEVKKSKKLIPTFDITECDVCFHKRSKVQINRNREAIPNMINIIVVMIL